MRGLLKLWHINMDVEYLTKPHVFKHQRLAGGANDEEAFAGRRQPLDQNQQCLQHFVAELRANADIF